MAPSCGASQQLLRGHHGTYGLLFNFPWTLAPEDGISSRARGSTELGDGAGPSSGAAGGETVPLEASSLREAHHHHGVGALFAQSDASNCSGLLTGCVCLS